MPDGTAILKKARLIQMYATLYAQFVSGPMCTAALAALKLIWALPTATTWPRPHRVGSGGPIYVSTTCGNNAKEIGDAVTQILRMGYTAAFEIDGKAFDSTVNEAMHDAVFGVYAACDPALKAYAISARSVRGSFFGVTTRMDYKLWETTKSGHSDTTLANTMINGFIQAEACYEMGLGAHILVAGDDALVFIKPADASDGKFARYCHELARRGFNPEGTWFRDATRATFISGMFLRMRNQRVIFLPMLAKMLSKLFYSTTPPPASPIEHAHQDGYEKHRSEVAACVLKACQGISMLEAVLRPMMREGVAANADYVDIS